MFIKYKFVILNLKYEKKGELEEEIEDVTVSNEIVEAEEEFEEYEKKQKPKPEPEPEPVVEEEEPKFIYSMADQHVIRRQTATFEIAVPTPRTRVRWLKDGKAISPSTKYDMPVSNLF
jgi:hypothetical protein